MPSIREIQEITGTKSPSSVHYAIQHLYKIGKLESDSEKKGSSRDCRLGNYRVFLSYKKDFDINNVKGRKRDVLISIVNYINDHNYPPSLRELGKMLGISSTSVMSSHIRCLLDEGLLETDLETFSSRAFRVAVCDVHINKREV